MPERLKAILDKITAWWKKFNTKQRSVLISIVAVVIVALVKDTKTSVFQTSMYYRHGFL